LLGLDRHGSAKIQSKPSTSLSRLAHSGLAYLAGWLGASSIHDPDGGPGAAKGGLAGSTFSCFVEHAATKQRMVNATARYFIGKAFGSKQALPTMTGGCAHG